MTASYLQNNDYTPLQLRKAYQLPINDIAQTVVALDGYWKQGAARVKAQYENVAGLNLTLKSNQEYSQEFLKQAQDQLKKLSTKDLSSRDVQQEGLNLFKPILENDAIKLDHSITNMRNSIISEAQMYKTKDGGKGYNDDNLKVALSAFKNFGADTDPNSLGAIFEKAKNARYTPFYDASIERMNILKNCKPNSVEKSVPNEAWITEISQESLSKEKLYGCLEAGYSEAARNQFRISGAAKYDGNFLALKDEYVQSAKDRVEFLNKRKAELEAEKQIALKKKIPFEKQNELDLLDEGITNFTRDLNTYTTWTNQDWEDRYEQLAYNAYFKRANEAFAESFAYEDYSENYSVNPYGIAKYNADRQDAREQMRFQNELTLKEIDYKNKILAGVNSDGSKMDELTRYKEAQRLYNAGLMSQAEFSNFLTLGEDNKGLSYNAVQQKVNESWNQEFQTISEVLAVAQNTPELKEMIKDLNIGDVNNFKWKDYGEFWRRTNKYVDGLLSDKDLQNDVVANKFKNAYNTLIRIGNEKNLWKGIIDDAKREERAKNEDLFNKDHLKNIKDSVTIEGVTLNSFTVDNILEGNDPRFKVVYNNPTRPVYFTGKGGAKGNIKGYEDVVYFNGKPVVYRDKTNIGYNGWVGPKEVSSLFQKVTLSNNDVYSKINKLVDKNIQNRTITQRFVLGLGDITQNKRIMSELETLYGQNLGVIGKDVTFSSVGGVDVVNGKIRLQASDKEGSISYDRLRDGIQKSVQGGLEINQIDKNTIELTLPSLKGITQKPTYYDVLKASIGIITKNPASIPPQGITKVLGKDPNGTQFELKINKQIGGSNPEYVLISKSPNGNANSQIIPHHQLDDLIAAISKGLEGNQ